MTDKELHNTWPTFIDPYGEWVRSSFTNSARLWGIWGVVEGSAEREPRHRFTRIRGRYQLQRCMASNNTKFLTDEAAWLYVWRRAQEGAGCERAALLYLRHKSPVEYAQLHAYCMERS